MHYICYPPYESYDEGTPLSLDYLVKYTLTAVGLIVSYNRKHRTMCQSPIEREGEEEQRLYTTCMYIHTKSQCVGKHALVI